MREGVRWHRHAQELAERCPALFDLEHEKALRRDRALDLVVVPPERLDHEVAVVDAVAELREDVLLEEILELREAQPFTIVVGKDRGLSRLEPPLRVAHGQNDLGIRVDVGELPPISAAGVIHRRRVSVENALPVRIAVGRGVPICRMAGIHEHFDHVIAAREGEPFERKLQRQRARTAEPGADDLQCHDVSSVSSVSRTASSLRRRPSAFKRASGRRRLLPRPLCSAVSASYDGVRASAGMLFIVRPDARASFTIF